MAKTELEELLHSLWTEDMIAHQRREREAIAKDPAAHRNTRLMGQRGLRYRYWEAKNARKQAVRFCYATTPNAAGYFLAWQETIAANGDGKRDGVRSYRLRREAKDSALHHYEAAKAEGQS